MNPRHIILKLDIDGTLINDLETKEIRWNGGTPEIWREYLTALKSAAEKENIKLHIGIATFKELYINADHESKKLRGDHLSARVLEDLEYNKYYPDPELKPGCGLKEFIDPELVFFTGKQSKTLFALAKAKNIIEERYQVKVNDKDIWIIDDDPNVMRDVEKTYSLAGAFSLSSGSVQDQQDYLKSIFKKLFAALNLAMPDIKIKAQEYKAPKKPLTIFGFMTPTKTRTFSPAEMTGIKPIDEEDPVANKAQSKGQSTTTLITS
ncbi:MAG: hypothetical protein ACYCQI_14800 [Gammaproteobacteria bacterium]